MKTINIKNIKLCVSCKYWYDPSYNSIRPKNPNVGLWEYDESATNMCLKTNLNKKSWATCTQYECKL